jgi:hypothetical protein
VDHAHVRIFDAVTEESGAYNRLTNNCPTFLQ